MSTRSMIAIEQADGKIKAIYSHWDGYPRHNGKILLESYRSADKIEALMNVGDVSSLGAEIGEKHDFEKRIDGVCTFYSRDRGDKDTEAVTYENEIDFWENMKESWCNYFYLFRSGKWYYSEGGESRKFKRLTKKVCKMD